MRAFVSTLFPFVLLATIACGQSQQSSNSSDNGLDEKSCCNELENKFPGETFTDTGSQSVKYESILDSYFNGPSRLPPDCFIQPTSSQQIASIVSILTGSQCKFAVKGGSHMLLIGANSIKGGVTIDLRSMHNVTLSTDKTVATVQPGAKWGDVYAALDPQGYAIPGGRASDVGVSGLTLGGGNSFFAARYGFVADNVKNFEIALGNGSLTNANAKENAELFKALKGGTGNLGIVTRFDYVAFPSGPLWGGVAVYNFSAIAKFYEPIVTFANNIANKPYGSLIVTWTTNGTTGTTTIGNIYDYTGNATEKAYFSESDPPGKANLLPAPFDPLAFSKVGTPVSNTLRVDSLYSLVAELNGANGTGNVYSAIIFKADTQVLTKVDTIIQTALKPYMSKSQPVPYTEAQIQYQPIPRIFTDHSLARGGNVLGLDRVKDNSILLSLIFTWSDPTKAQVVQDLLSSILDAVTKYTKSVPGAFRDWQYVNYAYADQDPIGSYGEANVKFLKEVSRKYDPQQVFQKLVPGGWKLGDAGTRKKQFLFNQFKESGTN